MYNNLIAELRSMVDMLDCQENKDLPIVYGIIRKFKEAASVIKNLEKELEDKTACLNITRYNYKTVKAYSKELFDELKHVKLERDAAVEDLTGDCDVCKNIDYCIKYPCWCIASNQFEWRGIKGTGGLTMGDLIDRDALIKSVKKWIPKDKCGEESLEDSIAADMGISMIMEIEEQPIVDAVPVVRCKNCERWQRHTKVDREHGPCRLTEMTTHENDFCSYGTRRAGNG